MSRTWPWFLLAAVIAAQLAWPALNLDLPWTTFGRLRPIHVNGLDLHEQIEAELARLE